MGALRVMTVPPEFLPAPDREEGFAVVLGDCVLPGHYLGRYPSQELADAACKQFGDHYGLESYPMNGPWQNRPVLRLIHGGKASHQSSEEQ